jgi:hypothetical protein
VFPAPKSGMPRIAIDRGPASRTGHMAQGILLLCACVFGLLSSVASAQMQYGYTNWTVDDGLPQNSIRGITQTPDGYIWIPTFDGLVRFDGVRFASFNRSNTKGIESNRFSGIVQGKNGELRIATDGAGLTRYHDGSFETYGREQGIENGTVRGLTVDLAGHLWILSADRIERWDNTGLYYGGEKTGRKRQKCPISAINMVGTIENRPFEAYFLLGSYEGAGRKLKIIFLTTQSLITPAGPIIRYRISRAPWRDSYRLSESRPSPA